MWQQNPNRTLTDGPWTIREGLSDEFLAALYLDMKLAGRVEQVFAAYTPGLREFMCDYAGKMGYSAWYQRPDSDVPVLAGYGFVNEKLKYFDDSTKVEVGVVFTERMGAENKSVFRRIHLAKGMLSALFLFGDVQSAIGIIPEPNTGAAALAGRVGVRAFGPVPNYWAWGGRMCGAYIVQTDAQTWLNQYPPVVELEVTGAA